MKNKRGILLVIILFVVLVGLIGYGLMLDSKVNKNNQKDYVAWMEQKKSEGVLSASEFDEEETKQKDFYSKLKDGDKINVLVIGDRIALSEGKNSANGIWTEGIRYILNKNYGVTVDIKILAETTDNIDKAIVYSDDKTIADYDLIIASFGYNDSLQSNENINHFKDTYKEAIKNIENKNKSAVKMFLIPSNIGLDNPYRKTIVDLASEESILIIDPLENMKPYQESIYINGGMPTDIAYQYYTQTFENLVKIQVGY